MPGKPLSLSVKIVLRDDQGRWLLLKRLSNSEWNPDRWDLPGGKLEPGEDLEDALVREVSEETELSISVHGVLGAVGDETPSHRLVHLIMMGMVDSGEVKLSSEHSECAWVPVSDIHTLPLCGYLHDLLVPH